MAVRATHPSLVLTHGLHSTGTAELVLEHFPDKLDPTLFDGLAEFGLSEAPVRLRVRAIHKLAAMAGNEWSAIVPAALVDPSAMVRRSVLELLARNANHLDLFRADVVERLRFDPVWMVRRAALELFPAHADDVVIAADDPHWRVRKALFDKLADAPPAWRDEILGRLAARQTSSPEPSRVEGMMGLLEHTWFGRSTRDAAFDDPRMQCPFWDWDDAVLAKRIAELSKDECKQHIGWFAMLLTHGERRIRAAAAEIVRRHGRANHLLAATRLLAEPRWGVDEELRDLLARVDIERAEEVATSVLSDPTSLDQQRAWATQVLGRERGQAIKATVPRYRSHRRAEELSAERARHLMEHPNDETSWHVLNAAARMARVPLWELAPTSPVAFDSQSSLSTRDANSELALGAPAIVEFRPLGLPEVMVSRMGLSGHYGLPVEGFVRGARAGINLFFWEPNYDTLTRFSRRLRPSDRARSHFIAGTFECEASRVRKDVEQALRNLRVDRLSLFLVFWVRSDQRIDDELLELLQRLKVEGKIAQAGLSTHDRAYAAASIEQGWNPVMVRHSAVHWKAEREVFPVAQGKNASVITFSNTCYGRLIAELSQASGNTRLSAADCYRYTLAQSAVTTCLTAPATIEQLDENLAALTSPRIDAAAAETLRACGQRVYEREAVFRRFVRDR